MPLIEFVDVNMPYCICYFNMPFLVRVMCTCRYVYVVMLTCR
jgi:hypothetical protein